jgi:hypothetical protein
MKATLHCSFCQQLFLFDFCWAYLTGLEMQAGPLQHHTPTNAFHWLISKIT